MVPENQFEAVTGGTEKWPQDVRETLAELDKNFSSVHDRRAVPRWVFHTEALLTVDHTERLQIWTRDINPWNVGYIARRELTVGANGTLRFEVPGGHLVVVAGLVKRSSKVKPGWFEGYVTFLDRIPEEILDRTR